MSKTTTTQGPWKFEGRHQGLFEHTGPVFGPDGHAIICHVELDDIDNDDAPWPEGEANARLIAAAPDMMMVLRSIAQGNKPDLKEIQTILNTL